MTGPRPRRRLLRDCSAAALLPFTGCLAAGFAPGERESRPNYLDDGTVVTERAAVELSPSKRVAGIGDTIRFSVTNTGSDEFGLGCHSPWAIQRRTESGWKHVAWTGEEYFQLCLTTLGPGETHIEEIEFSESALRQRVSKLATDLCPGTYRFLLLGSKPFLAVEFSLVAWK